MKNNIIYIITIICLSFFSCKKSTYLEENPDQALVIPKTLQDFQAVLDNDKIMNGSSGEIGSQGVTPNFGEEGADNYYVFSILFNNFLYTKPVYTWSDDDLYNPPAGDVLNWNIPYRAVFYANQALEGISKLSISPDQQSAYNNAKGSALFFRAYMFYELAQIFAPPYNQSTASTDWGIPLRLEADINESISRATVQQTYDRIINDLKTAASLLPITPLYKTRPSKVAVEAMLARVYLTMGDYDNAIVYATNCLQVQSSLIDYNTLNTASTFPFPRFNAEVIFHSVMMTPSLLTPLRAAIDSNLYKSYHPDDLRRNLFFRFASGTFITGNVFKGSYDQANSLFTGLATDEIYLIRAEAYARKNNAVLAMADLNTLMQTRWRNTVIPYPAFTATDAADALNKILIERRKELIFRGLRWSDLRRLNKEGANITITHIVNGQTYTLAPNSLRYTYIIPPAVLGFNKDMPQNPR